MLTFFEIFLPVLFAALLLLLRQVVDVEKYDEYRTWDRFGITRNLIRFVEVNLYLTQGGIGNLLGLFIVDS